jgi:hypothetical protein
MLLSKINHLFLMTFMCNVHRLRSVLTFPHLPLLPREDKNFPVFLLVAKMSYATWAVPLWKLHYLSIYYPFSHLGLYYLCSYSNLYYVCSYPRLHYPCSYPSLSYIVSYSRCYPSFYCIIAYSRLDVQLPTGLIHCRPHMSTGMQ